METPLKFRWVLSIVTASWLVIIGLMQIIRNDLTLAQSLIGPLVLMVALAPLSVRRIVSWNEYMKFVAVWTGITIPGTYLLARWITGYGSHCDKAMVIAGALCFVLILGIKFFRPTKSLAPPVRQEVVLN